MLSKIRIRAFLRSVWGRILLLFLIGGFGFSIIIYFLKFGSFPVSNFFRDGVISGLLWVALSEGNGYITNKLDYFYTWKDEPIKRMIISTLGYLVYTLLVCYLIFAINAYWCCKMNLAKSWQNLDQEFVTTAITITFFIALFLHGRGFYQNWKTSLLKEEKLRSAQLASHFESLKNQVNPHFLFNSLNVLSTLVYKDQDLAAKFIKQLSNVYRYILDAQQKEVVPLVTELEALNAYIFLLKIRFGDNLTVNINLDPKDDFYLAPLTLQILVENAIKHNIISKNEPLTINIEKRKDRICIRNNLQIKNNVLDSTGLGLPNIKERYAYISGKEVEVLKEKAQFIVKIPIIKLAH